MTDIPHTTGKNGAPFRRYLLVGVLSFGVNLALASAFHEMAGLSENFAAALSLAIVFVLNFVLARAFIYRDRGRWQGQILRFGAVSASARLGEYALFLILSNVAGMNYLLALATAQGISFVAKFFLYRKFAFNGAQQGSRSERDRALFDRIARRYHRKDLAPASRAARKLRLQQTLELIDPLPGAAFLEAGCGAGFSATYLAGIYGSYLGVDYSADLISWARRYNASPSARFAVGDVMEFRAESEFDVVFMIGLLHHMEHPAAAVAALARSVKPGGWVVANEPQCGNPLVSAARMVRKRIDRGYSDEQTEFSRRELQTIFTQAGLADVRIRPQGVFSTPFAEVSVPLQPVTAPLSQLCCAADRVLEAAAPNLLLPVAWNLIAAGRVPERG